MYYLQSIGRFLLFIFLCYFIYVDFVLAKDGDTSSSKLSAKGVVDTGYLGGSGVSDGYFSALLDLEYGADASEGRSGFKGFIRLHPYVSSARFLPFDIIERVSIEFSDRKFGLFEIGKHAGVASSMKVDAFSAAGMTRDSLYWFAQFDHTMHACNSEYCQFSAIYSPDLFSNNVDYYTQSNGEFINLGRDKRRDFKLSYISQDFSGLKFGISYIPGFEERRSEKIISYSNVLQCSIFYAGQINDVAYKFSVSYEGAGSYKDQVSGQLSNPLFGFEAGANIAYMGFTIGASTGFLGKSYSMKGEDSKSSSYNTLGLGYKIGPFGVGISYFNSVKYLNEMASKFDRIAFGLNYKFSNNILSSLEIFRFNLNFGGMPDNSSHGYMVLIGAKFKF